METHTRGINSSEHHQSFEPSKLASQGTRSHIHNEGRHADHPRLDSSSGALFKKALRRKDAAERQERQSINSGSDH